MVHFCIADIFVQSVSSINDVVFFAGFILLSGALGAFLFCFFDIARFVINRALHFIVAAITALIILNVPVIPIVLESKEAPDHPPSRFVQKDADGYVVTCYYVTDREPTRLISNVQSYSSHSLAPMSFGHLKVHIPPGHVTNTHVKLSLFSFLFRYHHPGAKLLQTAQNISLSDFSGDLYDDLDKGDDPAILLFIHGFRTTFAEAAVTAAKLAYELRFNGIVIVYSWPGDNLFYVPAENEEEYTVFDLEWFLERLTQVKPGVRVNIIAHSMGTHAVAAALSSMALKYQTAIRYGGKPSGMKCAQVVLAAPDVDINTFRRYSSAFPWVTDHVTIYVNQQDKALWMSNLVHKSPRAGSVPWHYSKITVGHSNTDIIDTSLIQGDFLNHSYYSTNRTLLDDISAVIVDKKISPTDRAHISATIDGRFQMRP